MDYDVLVLGAGIVGVSVAVELQRKGRSVALIDREAPGQGTSFGNAGLIQREAVRPYEFPHELGLLLGAAINQRLDVRYRPADLPKVAAPLLSYYCNSAGARYSHIIDEYASIIGLSLQNHRRLIELADAEPLIRQGGWMTLFRSEKGMEKGLKKLEHYQRHGVHFDILNPDRIHDLEPVLKGQLTGAIHWQDPWQVKNPEALTLRYADLFQRLGGTLLEGDADSLNAAANSSWTIQDNQQEQHQARQVVIALGPWSTELTVRFGFKPPLFYKRGYHMHFSYPEGPRLQYPILDTERGYFLSPMDAGLRLCTGAELALRDSPANPVQVDRAETCARELTTLGTRLDDTPWLGARPCIPDMKPLIGPMPGVPGIWCAFGHGHQGLTLGPATGHLLAQMMAGEKTDIDMTPFLPQRYQ